MSESEEEIRQVEKTGAGLEQQTDEMEHRAEELGSEIKSVREDFRHKRNDSDVPGLPPEPEAAQEKSAGPDYGDEPDGEDAGPE